MSFSLATLDVKVHELQFSKMDIMIFIYKIISQILGYASACPMLSHIASIIWPQHISLFEKCIHIADLHNRPTRLNL